MFVIKALNYSIIASIIKISIDPYTQYKPSKDQEKVIRIFLDYEESLVVDNDFIIHERPIGKYA